MCELARAHVECLFILHRVYKLKLTFHHFARCELAPHGGLLAELGGDADVELVVPQWKTRRANASPSTATVRGKLVALARGALPLAELAGGAGRSALFDDCTLRPNAPTEALAPLARNSFAAAQLRGSEPKQQTGEKDPHHPKG